MSRVFQGVGHGGVDPGAAANGLIEKNVNLDIAISCNQVLVAHGVLTAMSRYKDENDDLSEEIRECNAFKADIAIDFHNNAGGGDGCEIYYHYKGGVSLDLARNIEAEIIKIGQNSRGCKTKIGSDGRDYYGFIRETDCPAVIVECAFLDNANDIQAINTLQKRNEMGVAIAKGILKTLGIAFKAHITPTTSSNGLKRVIVDGKQIGAYKEASNVLNETKKAMSAGAKKIEILTV